MNGTGDGDRKKVINTQPTADPCAVYPDVPGITYRDFQLSPEGLTPEQRRKALDQLHRYQFENGKRFLGYQVNQNMNFEEDLKQYLNIHINNVGDPYQSGNFTVNSKFMERAVLDYFSSLWNAPWPHRGDPKLSYEVRGNSVWGYVLSMGSTEGNINALWNARDYLRGSFLLDDPELEHTARMAALDGSPTPIRRRIIFREALATDLTSDTHANLNKMIEVMHNLGVINIILSAGKEGAILSNGERQWVGTPPTIEEKNPTGAGDAMLAAVVYKLEKGDPILNAFIWGIASGSAAASQPGTGMASRSTVEKLLQEVIISEE